MLLEPHKCDCVSAPVRENSRWRVSHNKTTTTSTQVSYTFSLAVDLPSRCWEPSYRTASCCNATLWNLDIATAASVKREDILSSQIVTDEGMLVGVVIERTFWSTKLSPKTIEAQGRGAFPSLYVSNFTYGRPWKLVVTVARSAVANTHRWPCGPSKFIPTDEEICDIAVNGFQTLPGQPDVAADKVMANYLLPNCCPEGIMRFARPDPCCVDDITESPYGLSYKSAVSNAAAVETVFTFSIDWNGYPGGNAILPNGRPNCSLTEVDQALVYVNPARIYDVVRAEVDGREVDFTLHKTSDVMAWVRLINLHYTGQRASAVKLKLNAASLGAGDVCTTKIAESTMCEYVLKGLYSDAQEEFQCCPHSAATAPVAATCPPP